jgi:V8-like Glu-specific endopeptidase
MKTLFLLPIIVLTMSCGQKASDSKTKKVFGSEDFVSVKADLSNIPISLRPFVNATGRMSSNCTASHVGNGIVLTAGHCVGGTIHRRSNLDCSDLKIEWGVTVSSAPVLTSQCETILATQVDDKVDYAILRVKNFPQEKFIVSSVRKSNGTEITVLGYPEGRTLQWSQTCKVGDQGSAPFASLGFTHLCDTLVGSSGGPIVTQQGQLLTGIHNGGDSNMNYATNVLDLPLSEFLP